MGAEALHTIKLLKSRPRMIDTLTQSPNILRSMCRARSMRWKTKGDVARCIFWACHAEKEGNGRGEQLSEVLDSLLLDDDVGLDTLLLAFTKKKKKTKNPDDSGGGSSGSGTDIANKNQAPLQTVYSSDDEEFQLPNVPS